jgi:hypothetical protein
MRVRVASRASGPGTAAAQGPEIPEAPDYYYFWSKVAA